MVATYFAKSSVTISSVLIGHVKCLYTTAMDDIARGDGLQVESPSSHREDLHRTELALPAYILAVAAVEAFVNELFLSNFGEMVLGPRPMDEEGSLEKLDLPTKLVQVPHNKLGRSLDPGKQPHQDMKLLVQLRNELAHYKMGERPPKVVGDLAQRGIAFPVPPEQEKGGPHQWAERVSTLEGIRWAYNTACKTAIALLDLIPEEKRKSVARLRHNFREIP